VVAGRTDEIAVMYGGKIVEQAPTAELFANVRMPYTEALLGSIPKINDPSHTRLLAIGGRPPDLVAPPAGCNFAPRCLYAQAKCHTEEPPLVEDTPGHLYRCWYPVGSQASVAIRNAAGDTPAAPEGPEGVLDDADITIDPANWRETGDI
jgi:oligopeptide/dipeptide ABC transporter ATP-binding protein